MQQCRWECLAWRLQNCFCSLKMWLLYRHHIVPFRRHCRGFRREAVMRAVSNSKSYVVVLCKKRNDGPDDYSLLTRGEQLPQDFKCLSYSLVFCCCWFFSFLFFLSYSKLSDWVWFRDQQGILANIAWPAISSHLNGFFFSECAGENLTIITQSFMSFSFIDNMPEFECLATTFSEPFLCLHLSK